MESIEKKFKERITNNKLNTSYPLLPSDWTKYRTEEKLRFKEDETLSFYIHIPFCQNLCSFCEYTRTKCPNNEAQRHYLETLDKDIYNFIQAHPLIRLKGFDIGGGTPTILSDDNFSYLMDIFKRHSSSVIIYSNFEPSIEGTVQSLSENKLKMISKTGIKRVSLGIQSISREVLQTNKRMTVSQKEIEELMKKAKHYGIKKINFDLMYGLEGQSEEDIKNNLTLINHLRPEQVTLYELRTNMLGVTHYMSRKQLFNSYSILFNGLLAMGYQADFGQNTFSMNKNDLGVSSYLRSRMLDGSPYKGFGISAQSMSRDGISYNAGKNQRNLNMYLNLETYENEYVYQLPKRELLAKFIAISSYSGKFSLKIASAILKEESTLYYKDEIKFCLENGMMTLQNDILHITPKGFMNYGSVFSLFYLK